MPRPLTVIAGVVVATLHLAGAGGVARAEDVPARPAAGPPGVYYHIERIKPGANPHELGTADLTTGKFKPKYGDLDWGLDTAVHPGSGRFALTLRVAGDARTISLDGKQLDLTPNKPVIIAVGSFDKGIDTVIPGDPACVPIKCFEQAAFFSLDGSSLYTRQLHQSSTKIRRYPLAAPNTAALVFDRRKVGAAEPAPTPDLTRWAYDARDGIHVEVMPPLPAPGARKPPALPKLGKALFAPKILISAPVALLENSVMVLRREPKEQKESYFELWDVTTRKSRIAYTFKQEFVMWHAGFKTSASQRSILLVAERKLLAISIVDASVRTLADDANALFDVSADGRFALIETSRERTPDSREGGPKNPLSLTIIEIATGKRVASQAIPLAGASWVRTEEARFL
ncbi:MAG: hypothetical protein IT370_10285 [Deltaproteobacteria bacterium]|nr:hypothetical protein [Deltaproteobacteria bacterium]